LDISIIIVNWNTKNLLISCIDSIYNNISNLHFEIIVVDNGSQDGSITAVKEKYPNIILIANNKNLGFAVANNMAFKLMKGKYALLLNTDCILTKGAIEELFNFMEKHPEAGICCGQLLNMDGSKQNSFSSFPSIFFYLINESLLKFIWPSKFPSKYKSYSFPIKVDSCIGACMLIRKKALKDVGYFDEDYFFFFEETDMAYRMKKKGWEIYFIPSAYIYHAQGKSVGAKPYSRMMFYKSRYIFFKKHYPNIYRFFYVLIFLRVIINTIINFMGIFLTIGLNKSIKNKFLTYLNLIIWHIKGCPQVYPKGNKE